MKIQTALSAKPWKCHYPNKTLCGSGMCVLWRCAVQFAANNLQESCFIKETDIIGVVYRSRWKYFQDVVLKRRSAVFRFEQRMKTYVAEKSRLCLLFLYEWWLRKHHTHAHRWNKIYLTYKQLQEISHIVKKTKKKPKPGQKNDPHSILAA